MVLCTGNVQSGEANRRTLNKEEGRAIRTVSILQHLLSEGGHCFAIQRSEVTTRTFAPQLNTQMAILKPSPKEKVVLVFGYLT